MSKKPKAAARDLAAIVAEIRETYRNDTGNVIKRGNLLIEAKAQLKHGEWLSWLDENFSMDARTAQRAMRAAKFAAKYDSVSYLNLSVEALYAVSVQDSQGREAVINKVMDEAKTKYVSAERVLEIEDSLAYIDDMADAQLSDLEAECEAEQQRETEEQVEAESILDSPPPELPPTEPAKPIDFLLPAFDQAISKLKELSTKPSDKFRNSAHSAADMEQVAEFLLYVARTTASKAA